MLLILPADLDPVLVQQAQAAIGDLAASTGIVFQSQPDLQSADLPQDLAYLVWLGAPSAEDLTAATTLASTARIVAPGVDGYSPQPNLTLLQPPPDADLQSAFLAGFTAALITEDYRVASLVEDSSDRATAVADAFRAGAEYYCGLCRPERPPFEAYPLTFSYTFTSGSPASLLSGTGVQTVFLPPELAEAHTVADLADAGITLVGTIPPPPEASQHWAATFQPAPLAAVEAAWPEITGSSPPATVTMPITVQDVNDSLLSQGRLRLVIQTQNDIAMGLIDLSGTP